MPIKYRVFRAAEAAIYKLPRPIGRAMWWLAGRSLFRWTGYWTPAIERTK